MDWAFYMTLYFWINKEGDASKNSYGAVCSYMDLTGMYISKICWFINNNTCNVKESLTHANLHTENAPKTV